MAGLFIQGEVERDDIRLTKQLLKRGSALDAEFLAEEPTLDPELAAALRRSGRVVAGEISDGKTAASLVDAFAAIGSLSVDQRGGIPRRVSRLPTGSRRPALAFTVAELVEPSVAAAVDDSIWINFA